MSVVYLLPLGGAEKDIVHALEAPLRESLHAECVVANEKVELRAFYDSERDQYNSTAILRYMKDNFSTSYLLSQRHRHHARIHLAITPVDLFIPILTYVFGEAELAGDVAIVSYCRLKNELYGLPANRELLHARVVKEALHELGHALGLVHCRTQECVMHASTYVEDIDLKGENYCSVCRHLLDKQEIQNHPSHK